MSARILRASAIPELVDARRQAHRLLLSRPPSRLILAALCLDIGAELTRRGELAPACPVCRDDVTAALEDGNRARRAPLAARKALETPSATLVEVAG